MSYSNSRSGKGAKGEELFKEMLDYKNLAFLYIGQSAHGVEYSKAIKHDMQACRPDFFVNLQSSGQILVDVKTHRKYRLDNPRELFFYLSIDEISKLLNLHTAMNVPVWVAFIHTEEVKQPAPYFHFISIQHLYEYNEGLKKILDDDYEYLKFIRIPNDLFTKFKKDKNMLAFDGKISKVDTNLIDTFAKKHKKIIHLTINKSEKIPEKDKRKIIKNAKEAEKNKFNTNYTNQNTNNQHIKTMRKQTPNISLADIEKTIEIEIRKLDELKDLPNTPQRKKSILPILTKLSIAAAILLAIGTGLTFFSKEKKQDIQPHPMQQKQKSTILEEEKTQLYSDSTQTKILKAIPVK